MTTPANSIFYVNVFGTPYPTSQQLNQWGGSISDLTNSGVQTVIFYNNHIDPYGTIRSTNAQYPMVVEGKLTPGFAYLPELIQNLTAPGSSIQTVLFCIGGAGNQNDFLHAGALMEQYPGIANPLWRNFVALQSIGVDGFDFDLEPDVYSPNFESIVVQLTTLLRNLHMEVTYCPFTAQDFWMKCLTDAWNQSTQQFPPVSFLNLQTYAGGSGETQSAWAGYVQAAQNANPGGIGIPDPAAFVMAIFGATNPALCPNTLQSGVSNSSFMAKGAAGAGVFTYGGLLQNQQSGACGTNDSTADSVNAIVNGLAALNQS